MVVSGMRIKYATYMLPKTTGHTGDGVTHRESGSWVRFSRYDSDAGLIVAGANSHFSAYDPIAEHRRKRDAGEHTALDGLLSIAARRLRDRDAPNVWNADELAWCAENGLLGLLHHECQEIRCPPVQLETPSAMLGSHAQSVFLARGSYWVAVQRHRYDAGLAGFVCGERSGTWQGFLDRYFDGDRTPDGSVIAGLLGAVDIEESNAVVTALRESDRLEAPPKSATPEASWRVYREQWQDWLLAAVALASGVRDRDATILNELMSKTGVHVKSHDGNIKRDFQSASLLGTLAFLAAEDLSGGYRFVQCPASGCGTFFVSTRNDATYCKRECQDRAKKARKREIKKRLRQRIHQSHQSPA